MELLGLHRDSRVTMCLDWFPEIAVRKIKTPIDALEAGALAAEALSRPVDDNTGKASSCLRSKRKAVENNDEDEGPIRRGPPKRYCRMEGMLQRTSDGFVEAGRQI